VLVRPSTRLAQTFESRKDETISMGERVVYALRWTPKRAHRGLALVFLRSLHACLQGACLSGEFQHLRERGKNSCCCVVALLMDKHISNNLSTPTQHFR
jgi:hypothetical protein